MARGIKPYPVVPQFMETIVILQKRRPNYHVVVVGLNLVAYGR
ncbi:MAG: hypothetical protein ACTMUB_06270 [cyanobacterium endosymbiont of Rhopalodia musculus]|nr:hypothetical protein [cyanobacterium endosymbiont of Epithemia clementina EcSB]WGT67738.1 hypothetical protein P3F56_01125 [cyanobacterium endosymbiont of Epithemia clementina EcSB]